MEILSAVVEEINGVIAKVDRQEMERFVDRFKRSQRIFVDGEGRSGLMAKGFAMRLMHLGYPVFVVGETITPSVEANDLFVAVSGSGESENVVSDVKKAVKKGAEVLVVTSNPESTLAKLGQAVLTVPGTVKGDTGEKRKSIQLLSSLFDQSLHIVLDCVCLAISMRDQVSNDQATKTHW